MLVHATPMAPGICPSRFEVDVDVGIDGSGALPQSC
jgi:hypothetical protein